MPLYTFDVGIILERFSSTTGYFQPEHDIVSARHFSKKHDDKSQYHGKVVIGRLLSITTPQGPSSRVPNVISKTVPGGPKRTRMMNEKTAQYSNLLIFGDYYNPPNCFALFVNKKMFFQRLFGDDHASSGTVRIGDVFALKDPKMSDETLGESIIILREPVCVASLIPTGWPTTAVQTSHKGNHQVYFDDVGKEIRVYGCRVINTSHPATICSGYTCDRQGKCSGCFGRSPTTNPIVLQCDLEVLDAPEYKTGDCYFQGFTSFRFTETFFADISDLSTKHTKDIIAMHGTLQASIDAMVGFVNDHGGWRICGWHRCGVRAADDSADNVLSSDTVGHLSLVEPSEPLVLSSQAFLELLIDTPNDDMQPPVPPPREPRDGLAHANPNVRDDVLRGLATVATSPPPKQPRKRKAAGQKKAPPPTSPPETADL